MKAINGSKARYASYDHANTVDEKNRDSMDSVEQLGDEITMLHLHGKHTVTNEGQSTVTFHNNKFTATFQGSDDKTGFVMPLSSQHLQSRPESKAIMKDLDLVSDGISTDSNLEAMVSASSNKQLTPTNEQSVEFGTRSNKKYY